MRIHFDVDPTNQNDLMLARSLVMLLMNNELIATPSPAGLTVAPVTSAPAAVTPAVAPVLQLVGTSPAGVEIDSEGLPHDERIHASSKTKTEKGAWTKKKKVPSSQYEAVKNDLLQKIASGVIQIITPAPAPVAPAPVYAPAPVAPAPVYAPAPVAPAPVAPAPVAPAPVAPAPVAPAPVYAPAPAPVVPYVHAPIPAPAPVANGPITWVQMLGKLTAAERAGVYNKERMSQLLVHFGVGGPEDVPLLANRADLFETFCNDDHLGLKGF